MQVLMEGPMKSIERQPNIIFIMADDMGYGDVGCYNPESRIPTPNMDRLAEQGMRFSDAHAPSAICTPTRYGVLTGRYCWRTRLKEGVCGGYERPLIEPDRLTIASIRVSVSSRSGRDAGRWWPTARTRAVGPRLAAPSPFSARPVSSMTLRPIQAR